MTLQFLRTAVAALPLTMLATAGAPLLAQTTAGQTHGTHASGSTAAGTTSTGTAGANAGSGESVTPPAHPITQTQTREMFDLMGFKKLLNNNLTQMISYQKQSAPFVPQDVWTDLQNSFAQVDYVALFQPVYAKYLSEEDAAKALDFYRTPAGQRVVQAMPALMHDIMLTAQQNGQKVGHEVIERHRPEIEAAQKKYQAEHQPPSLNGGAAPSSSPSHSSTPSTTSPSSGTSQKPQ